MGLSVFSLALALDLFLLLHCLFVLFLWFLLFVQDQLIRRIWLDYSSAPFGLCGGSNADLLKLGLGFLVFFLLGGFLFRVLACIFHKIIDLSGVESGLSFPDSGLVPGSGLAPRFD